jgi:hypothetical protein
MVVAATVTLAGEACVTPDVTPSVTIGTADVGGDDIASGVTESVTPSVTVDGLVARAFFLLFLRYFRMRLAAVGSLGRNVVTFEFVVSDIGISRQRKGRIGVLS